MSSLEMTYIHIKNDLKNLLTGNKQLLIRIFPFMQIAIVYHSASESRFNLERVIC